jgi:hypothetical protein
MRGFMRSPWLCNAGDEVFEGAAKPVKLPDNQAVSRANVGKCFI